MSAPAIPATRERLLRAAHELTQEGGYASASVAAIAARAGVTASAMYRHFPSKADLFVELFRAVCGREIAAAQAAAERPGTVVERVEAVIATFAERALRNPRLAWALLAEPVDPLVDAERLAYRRDYRERIAGMLREGVAAGELPPQDEALTAAALVGGVGEALVGPLSPLAAGAPPSAELVAALRTFTRRAVGAA
ncbi:TetR/AcrR family transcriptional regulator [Conexibacter woesei]|uniref:Transcriptional regulator, TetR family n=1 Tax=Conexibacter woesei (strain DSM 14684 / CCUG 47730 / CIP 108061 / JCM 11494 / NBRC 100937 / ID131577) TaxID=469383 RepID=D3F9Q4_CONWI|nr:TetR/AcrR family transcriptional regulator [Conexibacter woesei]ADB51116.1 transcriptional regulator, TetR family [Conexibacter woesei DSM 14684]